MTKICPKCGTEHEKPGTFCSYKCSNSKVNTPETRAKRAASNKVYALRNPNYNSRPCIKCRERFKRIHRESVCPKCKAMPKNIPRKEPKEKVRVSVAKITPIQRTINLVESGEVRLQVEGQVRMHMRRYLIHRHGNVCSICHTTEWMGQPVPLVCDHIDGNSENSSIDNFRMVCCNCDAQLDTYKSKNRGNGRKYDREYKQRKVNPKVGDGSSLEMNRALTAP